MKRKSALLVIICLFIGAGLSQLSAQKTSQGWDESFFWIDVYCDGDFKERVEGNLNVHWIFHSGKQTWQLLHIKGTATCVKTGEVFKYIENDRKDYFLDPWVVKIHYNLKGNMGSHYVGTAYADLSDLFCCEKIVFTPIHTKCK